MGSAPGGTKYKHSDFLCPHRPPLPCPQGTGLGTLLPCLFCLLRHHSFLLSGGVRWEWGRFQRGVWGAQLSHELTCTSLKRAETSDKSPPGNLQSSRLEELWEGPWRLKTGPPSWLQPVDLGWVVRILPSAFLVLAFSLVKWNSGPPSGQWVGIGEVIQGPPPCRAVCGRFQSQTRGEREK